MRGDGGRFTTAAPSRLEARSRLGAQISNRIYRIGLLRIGQPPPSFIEPFRKGLNDLGYVEGTEPCDRVRTSN
jgi:hypothetical protein